MPNYGRFNETLSLHNINAKVIEKINAGFEEISDQSKRDVKRAYFQHAAAVLQSKFSTRKSFCRLC